MIETNMGGSKLKAKLCLHTLLVFAMLASLATSADVRVQQTASEAPIVFDALTFLGKPDLGLSQALHFIYEWEATLKDEGRELAAADVSKASSARTIEADAYKSLVESHADYNYLVIDIESLHPEEDPIAIRYVELAKAAAPASKVAWWNLGPRNVVHPRHRSFDQKKWQAEFDERKALVEANDFCILGSYFRSDDTLETWKSRHVPRIAEARRHYGAKPIFVTLAPHYFDRGKPWPFVSGKLLGDAMDTLAVHRVDGIVLWSFEGTGQLQSWDSNWDWVKAVRARTGPNGRLSNLVLESPQNLWISDPSRSEK